MTKTIKIKLYSKVKSNLNKLKIDPKDKVSKDKHFSVGALIKNKDKYLVINRNLYPPGYAGIAGHVNKRETQEKALIREVKEETNYNILSKELLFHEIIEGNECRTGFKKHEWYLYWCKCNGKLKLLKREEKSIKYLTQKQINKIYKKGKLEPVWEYWFKKLKLIK
ncbi:NUDIX hydrolase [Candidatus Woesearchaeota archaeon]|nr:NUDIX hydrolase [Candidatus Woesearchaeota archaeon]